MIDNVEIKIFDIQRFCVHDGPGIRTTVFLKGCNLSCPWCSNPESQSAGSDLLYFESKCVSCGRCAAVCPTQAIDFSSAKPFFNRERCVHCGKCVEICTQYAIELSGKKIMLEDIMETVRKDADYYRNTGGGLTVSGGEPLCQPGEAAALLRTAKSERIHTALETAASVEQERFEQVLPYTDLFLFDIKHSNPVKLKRIGADLELIKVNLKLAVQRSCVVARIPMIPRFNNTEEEISDIFNFAKKCGVNSVDLLPYHNLGRNKYAQLGRSYGWQETDALSGEEMEPYCEIGKKLGIEVAIGGKQPHKE